jgi:uncharacterized OB-fold protein
MTKPLPLADDETQGFWDGCREHELRVLRCEDCSTYIHQPAPMCHSCNSTRLSWQRVSGQGEVYSWVVVHHAPGAGFQDETPYVIAWIELSEQPGLRILSNVVGCQPANVEAGMRVQVEFQDVTDTVSLPVFGPTPG